ncbi:MAG TPA: dioxygenase [Ramlibacter sp.]|nr:dioxygenase [Ramlibacter sp.]
MIVDQPDDLTLAVQQALRSAGTSRLQEILEIAVRHLHAFVREARLTEPEFQQACAVIARLGQCTTASHNEVVLAAGSLGISTLVCLLNNGDGGRLRTTANLLGPFWRAGSPATPDGGSIVRSPTPGEPVLVEAVFRDRSGAPVADAEVDVWHASTDGFYENQDPAQADMNLRGTFRTDAGGRIRFQTIKPVGYPIPVDGPVGDMLRATGRNNVRPAHIHFLARKDGCKTQFAQVYSADDPHLQSDCQFGVTAALVGHYQRHEVPAPWGQVQGPWWSLRHEFVLDPGTSTLPRAPITAKGADERPAQVVLKPPYAG